MSTYFRPSIPIPLKRVKELCDDGSLENIKIIFDKKQNCEILYDGNNYIHFDTDKEGNIIDLYRYGRNDETEIFEMIGNEFDINFVSEYDNEYIDLQSKDTNVINISIER